MRLKKLSRNKLFGGLIAVVASLGLLDAVLLTQQHYTGKLLPCSVTGGCEEVLTSKYSEVFGVPLALFGVIFYIGMLVIALYYLQLRKLWLKWLLLLGGTVGFISSLGLVYIQGVIIQAWCQYCLLSALSSTLIFLFAGLLFITKEDTKHDEA